MAEGMVGGQVGDSPPPTSPAYVLDRAHMYPSIHIYEQSGTSSDRIGHRGQVAHRATHRHTWDKSGGDEAGQTGQTDPGVVNDHGMGWDETPHKFAIELDAYSHPSRVACCLTHWDQEATLVKVW